MVIINNNSGLTEAVYSGTNLSEIYVGDHLVWPVNETPPTPIGNKITYTISGNTSVIPCNETDILSYQEIMLDISNNGGDMRDISGMTDAIIGDCVGELHPLCFAECWSLSSVTLANTVTEIDYQAFYNCHSLSALTIPNGVTAITDYMLAGCDNLRTFDIPNGVTEIGIHSFHDCLSYLDVTIPSTVTKIGDSAFRVQNWSPQDAEFYRKMMYLKDHRVVRCLATTPPEIGSTVFAIKSGNDDIATYKIYVPAQSVDAYKAAWVYYADRIEPIAA